MQDHYATNIKGEDMLKIERRRSTVIAVGILASVVMFSATVPAFAASSGVFITSGVKEVKTSGKIANTGFCGTKKIKLGVLDGYGMNAWSAASYAAVRSEAAKCPNVTVITQAGQGDLPKSISQLNALVSQGVNAVTIIPDFGKAQLPSLQAATAAGVKVVPWGADPGGMDGTDFVGYVDWSSPSAGTLWATWMVKQLGGKGNVVFLGGPAGNPVTDCQLLSIVKVFASKPGIKLLTGNTGWSVTNWDPATAQANMSALLAKYPKIDGLISDYGTDALAALRAIKAAGRPLIPTATLEANGLGCLWKSDGSATSKFQLATISSRNWLGRIAARKAIAAAQGLTLTEPNIIALPISEDSTSSNKPVCVADGADDLYNSNLLSAAELKKYGTP
jgi:ribose transport system substrate-binding protein